MGRIEASPEVNEGPLAEFAAGLRSLRKDAGNPSFRTLARKTQYSASTLSVAAAGRSVPSLSVVRAYVRACDADTDEWSRRWRDLIAQRTGTAGGTASAAAPSAETPEALLDAQPLASPGIILGLGAADGGYPQVPAVPLVVEYGPAIPETEAPDGGYPHIPAVPLVEEHGPVTPETEAPVSGYPQIPAVPPPALYGTASTAGGPASRADGIHPTEGGAVPMPPSHSARSDSGPVATPAMPAPIPVPLGSGTTPWSASDEPSPPPPAHELMPLPEPVVETHASLEGEPGHWPPNADAHRTNADAHRRSVDLPAGTGPRPTTADLPPTGTHHRADDEAPVTTVDPPAADAALTAVDLSPGREHTTAAEVTSLDLPPSTQGEPESTRREFAATDRTPGTRVARPDAGPGRPKSGPRHRAPKKRRGWRRKVLALTVVGVVGGGVYLALPDGGHGNSVRAAAADTGVERMWVTRPFIGPGCGTKAQSSAFPATAGDGWTDVGGGPPQCGGHSLASDTTSNPTTVQDTYTWSFDTARSARCKALVFVSAADPSPGMAHYEVSGGSQRLASFTIDQKKFKGRWVSAGPFTTFDSKLQIKLTDQPENAGARHHVNASAMTLSCIS